MYLLSCTYVYIYIDVLLSDLPKLFYPTKWDDVLPIDSLMFFQGVAQPPVSMASYPKMIPNCLNTDIQSKLAMVSQGSMNGEFPNIEPIHHEWLNLNNSTDVDQISNMMIHVSYIFTFSRHPDILYNPMFNGNWGLS